MPRDTAVVHTTHVNNLHTKRVNRETKHELRVQEQKRCVRAPRRGVAAKNVAARCFRAAARPCGDGAACLRSPVCEPMTLRALAETPPLPRQ